MTQMMTVKRVVSPGLTLQKTHPPFYSCFFHNVGLREKSILGLQGVTFVLYLHGSAITKIGFKPQPTSWALSGEQLLLASSVARSVKTGDPGRRL